MTRETFCRAAYAGALADPCPNCRAQPDQPCTRTDEHGTHIRRVPCVARVHPTLIQIEDTPELVDFTQPRHERAEP